MTRELTHQRVDSQPVYLSLRCACRARREIETTMNRVGLAVAVTGWTLGTMGSRDADVCSACAAEARGRVA